MNFRRDWIVRDTFRRNTLRAGYSFLLRGKEVNAHTPTSDSWSCWNQKSVVPSGYQAFLGKVTDQLDCIRCCCHFHPLVRSSDGHMSCLLWTGALTADRHWHWQGHPSKQGCVDQDIGAMVLTHSHLETKQSLELGKCEWKQAAGTFFL